MAKRNVRIELRSELGDLLATYETVEIDGRCELPPFTARNGETISIASADPASPVEGIHRIVEASEVTISGYSTTFSEGG